MRRYVLVAITVGALVVTVIPAQDHREQFQSAPVYSEFFNRVEHPSYWVPPEFYPAGWSRDGTFAYLEVREDEGLGGYSVRLTAVDLVTDEVLVKERAKDTDHPALVSLTFPDETDAIVRYAFELWAGVLGELGIEPAGEVAPFEPFPIVRSGVTYEPELWIDFVEEFPGFDNIKSYELRLYGDDGTSKRIGGSEPAALDVFVAGCFPSPFENRIAIILIEERFAFEGTAPTVVVMGSNMGYGFE